MPTKQKNKTSSFLASKDTWQKSLFLWLSGSPWAESNLLEVQFVLASWVIFKDSRKLKTLHVNRLQILMIEKTSHWLCGSVMMSSFIYITKQAADKYKNQFDSWTRPLTLKTNVSSCSAWDARKPENPTNTSENTRFSLCRVKSDHSWEPCVP